MKHITCFHLFNDYSGSPKVLKMVLKGLLDKGYRIDLVSSVGGILDELQHSNLRKYSYRYCFSQSPIITMLRYTGIQLYTFFLSFRYLFNKDAIFYINTLLPIGPALAGRLTGKKVVYHYHEDANTKGMFYRLLAWAMQKTANNIICVSAYQASFLNRKKGITIIPNALPDEFVNQLQPNIHEAFKQKTVLMLSSLKKYKGTYEFIKLAINLPELNFVLVINDTQDNIDKHLKSTGVMNLTIYPRQENVAPFYNNASLVLNLSDKEQFVETFGLTALEAMSCGLPVIVPTVGGIAEMVEDGINGYRMDVQELDEIKNKIVLILSDEPLYLRLSKNALVFSRKYREERMIDAFASIV